VAVLTLACGIGLSTTLFSQYAFSYPEYRYFREHNTAFVISLGVSGMLHALLVFPGTVDPLYGGRWFDPMVFGGLSLLVAAIALAACSIPARRATAVDPMVALRDQ
jgi:hypothetical protein